MIKSRRHRKAARHERSGVLEAFVAHKVPLGRFIARLLHNAHDVEDVVQEAFLRAYTAEKSKRIEQPKSFLFRIAKNIALTQLTKKSRQITSFVGDLEALNVLQTEDTAEDEVIARQSLGMHCDAIAELSPQCRRVYLMRQVYGMSHKEIAARQGIVVKTVEKHLTKAFAHVDHYLRERTDPRYQARQERQKSRSRGAADG